MTGRVNPGVCQRLLPHSFTTASTHQGRVAQLFRANLPLGRDPWHHHAAALQLFGVFVPPQGASLWVTDPSKRRGTRMDYIAFLLERTAFYSVDRGLRYFACALVEFAVLWMSRR